MVEKIKRKKRIVKYKDLVKELSLPLVIAIFFDEENGFSDKYLDDIPSFQWMDIYRFYKYWHYVSKTAESNKIKKIALAKLSEILPINDLEKLLNIYADSSIFPKIEKYFNQQFKKAANLDINTEISLP